MQPLKGICITCVYNQFKAREVIFTNKTMYKCGVLKIKNFQFSSVIIFRETMYMTTNK